MTESELKKIKWVVWASKPKLTTQFNARFVAWETFGLNHRQAPCITLLEARAGFYFFFSKTIPALVLKIVVLKKYLKFC